MVTKPDHKHTQIYRKKRYFNTVHKYFPQLNVKNQKQCICVKTNQNLAHIGIT